jgi:hypothetical protein
VIGNSLWLLLPIPVLVIELAELWQFVDHPEDGNRRAVLRWILIGGLLGVVLIPVLLGILALAKG